MKTRITLGELVAIGVAAHQEAVSTVIGTLNDNKEVAALLPEDVMENVTSFSMAGATAWVINAVEEEDEGNVEEALSFRCAEMVEEVIHFLAQYGLDNLDVVKGLSTSAAMEYLFNDRLSEIDALLKENGFENGVDETIPLDLRPIAGVSIGVSMMSMSAITHYSDVEGIEFSTASSIRDLSLGKDLMRLVRDLKKDDDSIYMMQLLSVSLQMAYSLSCGMCMIGLDRLEGGFFWNRALSRANFLTSTWINDVMWYSELFAVLEDQHEIIKGQEKAMESMSSTVNGAVKRIGRSKRARG